MVSLGKVLRDGRAGEERRARDLAQRASADEAILKSLIADHHKWTGSLRAREILDTLGRVAGEVRQGLPERVQARAGRDRSLKATTALGESDAAAKAGDTIAKAKSEGRQVRAAK